MLVNDRSSSSACCSVSREVDLRDGIRKHRESMNHRCRAETRDRVAVAHGQRRLDQQPVPFLDLQFGRFEISAAAEMLEIMVS